MFPSIYKVKPHLRMENHKGKSPVNPFSNNDQVIKIDLTLKLGLSINEKQKVEEENKDVGSSSRLHGFSSVVDQPSNYDQVFSDFS